MVEGPRRVVRGDPAYPRRLEDMEVPPEAIWVTGAGFDPEMRAVAIVGTRHPTPYGLRTARRLAANAAEAGLVVISGLALGIDGAAHLGALDVDGVTIAVLAGGVDVVHPRTNAPLAVRIVERGALVSRYPLGAGVHRPRFLERNEIIAALADAVVIIEGVHPTSGALSTASRAHALSREVLAVPGQITCPQASAPNELIKDGTAPCLGVEDIIGAIEHRAATLPNGRRVIDRLDATELVTDPNEALVIGALGDGRDATQVAAITGLASAATADLLLDLELRGLVKRSRLGAYCRRSS